jgi:hypothetical protein
MQGLEHRELLRDDQRGVVRQHHAAGADLDALGLRGHVGDQDRRTRAGDTRHVVVLGDPEAPIAQAFDVAGELGRAREGFGAGLAGADGRELENGERNGHDRH